MNREAARVEIVAAVQAAAAAWTDYPCLVDYDNKAFVDYATQVNPYLAIDIAYIDSTQMDLGLNPIAQAYGNLILAVCVKEGAGTRKANLLSDHFTAALQFKRWPVVETQVARLQPNVYRKGWCCIVTLIPFQHQSQI